MSGVGRRAPGCRLERCRICPNGERPASFGQFRVQEHIGSGSFGDVFVGWDETLERTVAIKALADNWIADGATRERFIREARFMAALEDPGVLTIYAIDEAPHPKFRVGQPYFVMEYCRAGTLHDRLEELGPLTAEEGLGLIEVLASCTGVLHRPRRNHPNGIVHRDLKPSNYVIRLTEDRIHNGVGRLLQPNEELVVGDFGLARTINKDASQLTLGGGTPGWSAPEQFQADPKVDATADIYALSAITVSAFSGVTPVPVMDPSDQPFPPNAFHHAGPFSTALELGLSYEPTQRQQTIDEWRESLLDVATDDTRRVLAPVGPPPLAQSAGPSTTDVEKAAALAQVQPDTVKRPRRVVLAGVILVGLGMLGTTVWQTLLDDASLDVSDPATTQPGAPTSAQPERDGVSDNNSSTSDATSTEPILPQSLSYIDPISVFEGHTSWVKDLVDLGDGRVASSSNDNTIRVWDLGAPDSDHIVFTHPGVTEFGDELIEMELLPDGRIASVGHGEGPLHIWDPNDPAADPTVFSSDQTEATSLLALADGRVAVGTPDGRIQIRDANIPAADPVVLRYNNESIIAMVQLPSGQIAAGNRMGTVLVWEPSNSEADPLVLPGHVDSVRRLVAMADGRLATASDDGTVRVWNVLDPTVKPIVIGEPEPRKLLFLYSAELLQLDDGRLVFTQPIRWKQPGEPNRVLKVWDPSAPAAEPILLGSARFVTGLVEMADGRLASSPSPLSSADVIIEDLANPAAEPLLLRTPRPGPLERPEGGVVVHLQLSDGRLVGASVGSRGKIWIWDPGSS